MTTSMRVISEEFVEDLISGILHPILEIVKKDSTLSLNIRNNYINIYYRGGNIMKISEERIHNYNVEFDMNYLKNSSEQMGLPTPNLLVLSMKSINELNHAKLWIQQFPLLKCAMDIWFGDKVSKYEREFQQLVERTNNHNYATDYFICDVEYTNPDFKELRADMIALRWRSTKQIRQSRDTSLAIIEMKFKDSAMNSNTQTAGICDHIEKLQNAIDNKKVSLSSIADEMREVFNTRVKLGLIHCHSKNGKIAKEIEVVNYNPTEYILLLADHDPDSSTLLNELNYVNYKMKNLSFDVKVSVANFMGYGLFDQGIVPLDDFLNKSHKFI